MRRSAGPLSSSRSTSWWASSSSRYPMRSPTTRTSLWTSSTSICHGACATPRSDVDVIATEHGAVRLNGLPLGERVKAMVSIAAPQHRDALLAAWKEAR
ncbi:MAG TPA: acetyl-CoA hydrolase/transferase C-terminal domain-containing protein [Thermoanaerobaculia bacterium]|nr:acetyl-CoA hydrolase/transferase C-terminal domain-containing protein [Thermoanaerobaculia bacterium]